VNTIFNHQKWVGEYIFFLFWPWNKIFENRRYLSTPPFFFFLATQKKLHATPKKSYTATPKKSYTATLKKSDMMTSKNNVL